VFYTWLGGDGDFGDGNNWEDDEGNVGTAPTPGDDAQISGGTISGTGTVTQLDIDGSVTFTGDITVTGALLIDNDTSLTISDGGSFTFTANTFTVNAGAVLTVTGGSFLQSNGIFLEGTGQQLVIENGGSAEIGSLDGSGLLVDGDGSNLDISTFFGVGDATISDGATVTIDSDAEDAFVTTLTMTDDATLTVGDFTATNAIIDDPSQIISSGTLLGSYAISNGGTVSGEDYQAFSGETVSVTNVDSQFSITDTLLLDMGTLNASDHAEVSSGDAVLAMSSQFLTASATLATNASWSISGDLTDGDAGTGSIDVLSGATLSVTGSIDIAAQNGSVGDLTLDGAGSQLSVGGDVTVGDGGSGGLTISGGATTVLHDVTVASTNTSMMSLLAVTDAATHLTVNNLTIADGGDGGLMIGAGGALSVSGDLVESSQAGSTGSDTIGGTGNALQVKGAWTIADSGTHDATLQDGISVSVGGELTLGKSMSGDGTLDLVGPSTVLTTGGVGVTIGDAGAGTLSVSAGGLLDASGDDVTAGDQDGATGVITESDSEIETGSLTVGGGGTGTLSMNGGTIVVAADLSFGDESTGDGSGTLQGDGLLSVGGNLTVGGGGQGDILVEDGSDVTVSGDASSGDEAAGGGTITVNGASVDIQGSLAVGNVGSGLVLVQQAGTMSADAITIGNGSAGSGELDLDGSGSGVTSHDFTVGEAGSGTLNVKNGASLVSTGDATIADVASGTPSTALLDTGGSWSVQGGLTVGGSGIGVLTDQGGAVLRVTSDLVIGDQKGAGGSAIVIGTSATPQTSLLFGGSLQIGNSGMGTLDISAGATVAALSAGKGEIDIGVATTGTGTVDVSGLGSALDGTLLAIGGGAASAGGSGILMVGTGALADVTSAIVWSAGTVDLTGGSVETDPLQINGGTISGFGTLTGAVTDDGSIIAAGGTLDVAGNVSGGGQLVLDATSVLLLQGTVDTTDSLTFAGPNATMLLGTSADVLAKLSGLSPSDAIGIRGAQVTSAVYDTSSQDLLVTGNNGSSYDLGLLGSYQQSDFAISGGEVVVVCFLRGTMIRTPDGELPVEKLRPGKQVITLIDDEEVPQTVIWLGHRRISLAGHPRPETVAPIRIKRDAFADGMPHRDLMVSPDHAIYVDGKLICARQLVNGATIRQELDWTAVDYYHVELDQHAILLAEGLPAESYIDTGNRGFFDNSGAPLVLHPDLTDESDYPTREAGSCVPFVWDEASVQPVWQRLADRAAAIGRPGLQRTTTTDADLRLLSDRRTVQPVFSDSDRVIFVLPRGASEVQLVSRAQSPTEARPWLEDRRRLGVRVKRIVLRGADEMREVPMDHPDLTQGWWAVERDGQVLSRWTNGEAVLPLPSMSGNVMLEIHLAGWMTYAVDAASEGGKERRAAA
jgi:T5SS/PEP-CTERM-associated repeat protein